MNLYIETELADGQTYSLDIFYWDLGGICPDEGFFVRSAYKGNKFYSSEDIDPLVDYVNVLEAIRFKIDNEVVDVESIS